MNTFFIKKKPQNEKFNLKFVIETCLTMIASNFSSTMDGPNGSIMGSTCTINPGLTDWEKKIKK